MKLNATHMEITRRIDQGLGNDIADLVIKNATLFNLVTGSQDVTDIAICGNTIVGTYDDYDGIKTIDGTGLTAVPGFIDTHLHVESSLVTPHEFERLVLPLGTTTAICDPHEICNVLGLVGLEYFLNCADRMTMDLRVQLSSCVPATDMETSGATLRAADLIQYLKHDRVIGLAEFMNFPGVLNKDPECIEKLARFSGKHIDGHCPLLRGKKLNAYLSSGILNDHESTGLEEAREKLSKGMRVLIREGSVTKDLTALAPLLDNTASPFVSFCTDDRNPLEINREGHINFMIKKAISLGVPVLAAYRASSQSAAIGFGLNRNGLIAPGYIADIVLLNDLSSCDVHSVLCGGTPVNQNMFDRRTIPSPVGLHSVKLEYVSPDRFDIPVSSPSIPVIGIIPHKIITRYETHTIKTIDGLGQCDVENDIIKVCVIERHGKSGTIGKGFCRGFGMKKGAIASSVGHDSHNISVAGTHNTDMALAVNRIIDMQGGYVVVIGGKVIGELPLPVAGLMSSEPFEQVEAWLSSLHRAVRALHCELEDPFQHLAFMPLAVIPHLKLTDRGLFDCDKFEFVPL